MVGIANSDNLHLVDDFYFSALHDDEEVFPISDEKYALELQLQEALLSSAISSRVPNGSRDLQECQVDDEGSDVVESECPNCRRLFCAQCKVAWHAGISCSEFQNLSKDERCREDIMVMELAKKNNWRRCPNCADFTFATVVDLIGIKLINADKLKGNQNKL
ncbi:hypothetical protein CRYUN_Cryun31cG0064500 [Craigia yunnanensis]